MPRYLAGITMTTI